MSGTIGSRFVMPYPQEVDANGVPLSGGLLYFYSSGTSTPQATYSDSGLTTPNTNPVVAASDGVWPSIWLGPLPYKVILTTSTAAGGVQVWTADPVYASGAESAIGALANIAALRALNNPSVAGAVFVEGYFTGADGGEGIFWYNAIDTTSSDNGGTIIVDSIGRRWYRDQIRQEWPAQWFGAKCDGTTDDSAQIQALLSTLGSANGGTMVMAQGAFSYIAHTIAVPANCRIVGLAGPLQTAGQTLWTRGCGFIVATTATFNCADGAQLQNLVFKTPGLLSNPSQSQIIAAVANWGTTNSTAITVPGSTVGGIVFRDLFIIGFTLGMSLNCGELDIRDICIDCYNGVQLINGGDNSILDFVRVEPFYSGFNQPSQARPGIAFNLASSTGFTFRCCFAACWVTGFFYTNLGACVFEACGYEWFSGVTKPANAFAYQGQGGASPETKFKGCYAVNASGSWLLSEINCTIALEHCSAEAPTDGTYQYILSILDGSQGIVTGMMMNLSGEVGVAPVQIENHTSGNFGWKFIAPVIYNIGGGGPPAQTFSIGTASLPLVDLVNVRVWGATQAQTAQIRNTMLNEKVWIRVNLDQSSTDGSPVAGLTIENDAALNTGFANRMISFWQSTNEIATITMNTAGTAVAYNTSSDERLKDQIEPITNSGTIIDQLNPVAGVWKGTTYPFQGFLAQQLVTVIPTAVIQGDMIAAGRGDPGFVPWSIGSTDPIVPYLVAEVKALRTRMAAVEATEITTAATLAADATAIAALQPKT